MMVDTSGIVVKVTLLLGLHLHDTFHIILVLQACPTPTKSVHPCFDADCFQLGTVEIIGRSS